MTNNQFNGMDISIRAEADELAIRLERVPPEKLSNATQTVKSILVDSIEKWKEIRADDYARKVVAVREARKLLSNTTK